MRFIELNKSLQQGIKQIYTIIGDDFFLIKQAINKLKTMTIKAFEEFNFASIDGSRVKTDELNTILDTLPFNNDYRLIYITDLRPEIVDFINKYDFASSNYLVLVTNNEKIKNAEIIDCSKLDRIDINKYILNELAKNNLSIEEPAMEYLIDMCDQDMTNITSELNKLICYTKDDKIITHSIVANLVSDNTSYAIFMLTNAIDNKDYAKYQQIMSMLDKSNSYTEIFMFMGKYFRRMEYIALNKNDNELSKILNIKPYAIKKSREYIAKNGIKYYINLYQKYIELDYLIKSGKISVYNALYELIF